MWARIEITEGAVALANDYDLSVKPKDLKSSRLAILEIVKFAQFQNSLLAAPEHVSF
jgi:hypothetical protein